MNKTTSYIHYFNSSADTLDVVLHGGSKGIDSPLMVKVFQALREAGHSVISFNFPYLERNEENSSGPDLKEELHALSNFLDLAKADEYKHIRFVAKSLGGIVASYFLKSIKGTSDKYSVVILGYVKGNGGVELKDFPGKISIIQGSEDKFGNIEA